jgi:hypothetical protein
VVPLNPGEETTLTWNGLLYDFVELPESCMSDYLSHISLGDYSCRQGKTPAAQLLELELLLFATADECSPFSPYGCSKYADQFTIAKSIDWPSQTTLQIDVE